MYRPDYETLRRESGFGWSVRATYPALLELTGIPIQELYRDPQAGIELYRKGRPLVRKMFGPIPDLPAPSTPAISYGHINALGIELVFPEGGEVNYERNDMSLEELTRLLRRDVAFESAGMAPFYLDYRETLREAFPDEEVGFSFSLEGPMTTAYELRDIDVFADPYESPEELKEFLAALTDSIVEFSHFLAGVRGHPPVNPAGGSLVDDVASMFGPAMWPVFVLPYIEQYYQGTTTGKRRAHIEDLRQEQLPLLEKLNLVEYDPSISHKLNPKIIRDTCRIPFGWRLGNFHYYGLTPGLVRDFVFQAVADGASRVWTDISYTLCNDEMAVKVKAFIEAARQVEAMLSKGAGLDEIGRCVSKEGRVKFWDNWPESRFPA